MNDLVFLSSSRVDAEAYTTPTIISGYSGIAVKTLNNRINQYREDFLEFGLLLTRPLIGQVSHSGPVAREYLLNEQQASLLLQYSSNTVPVRKFKKALAHAFFNRSHELAERQARFELGKEFSKGLGTAVAESQIDQHGHEFSNFNRLVYRQALGVDSTKLRKARSIPRDEPITHYLTSEEAEAVRLIKQRVTTFLGAGMDYQQIKNVLSIKGVILQITLKLPTTAK